MTIAPAWPSAHPTRVTVRWARSIQRGKATKVLPWTRRGHCRHRSVPAPGWRAHV